MSPRPATLLRQLERIKDDYVEGSATKLRLLRALARARLSTADQVLRLHEALCFLHAYPDDREVMERVESMLASFARRSDVRRHADALADTGVAGSPIYYQFYWPTAKWLVRNWPDRVSIDWSDYDEDHAELGRLLTLLVPYGETLALDEAELTTREWIDYLKGPRETDAAFLVRRMSRLRMDPRALESQFDELQLPLKISPGPGTPARSGARHVSKNDPVSYQTTPLVRSRPDLRVECRRPPLAVRPVSRKEGERLIDLTREAMVTRARDLYAFKHADADDVRLVDCGDGLQFAAMGIVPEARLVLDSVYGYLTMRNGVPIGYVLSSAYFNSVEVAYNVFETYRGAEAGPVYGRVLAMMRHLFDADVFTIDPYQLGYENEEGLESGAWWFYYKLGFRPYDPNIRRLARKETAKIRRNPRYRSSLSTLNELASADVFYFLQGERTDVRGLIPLDNIGLAVSRYVARRFGSDRETATTTCSEEAARLLGARSLGGLSRGERQAWERWAPLILTLPGVAGWSADEKRALARVARAKGGRRESDYVLLLDRHRKLRRALLKLAARELP